MFAQGGLHYSVTNIRSLPSDIFLRFLIAEDVHAYDEYEQPRTKPLYLDVCQKMRTNDHSHYGEFDVSIGKEVSVNRDKHHTVSIQVGHLDDFSPMQKFKYFKLNAWKLVPKHGECAQTTEGEWVYGLDSLRVVDGIATMLKQGRANNLATMMFTIKTWPNADPTPQIAAAQPEEVRLRFTFVNLEDQCQTFTQKLFRSIDGAPPTS